MTLTKKKAGRPKTAETARLSEVMSFAATSLEAAQIDRRAKEAGVSVSKFLRNKCKQAGILL